MAFGHECMSKTSGHHQKIATLYEKGCRHLNTGHHINWPKKWKHFHWKNGFKTTSVEFLGMYDLDFSCSSIFHQLWAHIRHFKGKKVQLIFHPVFALFSLPGRLPKAIITPWKCLLRVPWWNTFQWGPKKPPKPFLANKNFQSQIPKSHSQPSVQYTALNSVRYYSLIFT